MTVMMSSKLRLEKKSAQFSNIIVV